MVGVLRGRLECLSEEMFLSDGGKSPECSKLALYTPESPLGCSCNAILPDKSRAYESLPVASGNIVMIVEVSGRWWNWSRDYFCTATAPNYKSATWKLEVSLGST